MHADSSSPPDATEPPFADNGPWYRGLTGYHWFVLIVAALGWLFDTMDQQLFNLARKPAMEELLATTDPTLVNFHGTISTSIFMIGWAVGGIFFGILGDKIGRAKTMLLTILIYSLFTGLSALSVSVWDFALYRFLTGLGVGGEFAVGVALVAEVMPDHARARALGWLQALSAVGNMTAAMIAITLGAMADTGFSRWRIMFVIGALPALLAIVIRLWLKEPERWQKAAHGKAEDAPEAEALPGEPPVPQARQLGSISELFGDPRWRRNTIVGMLLAFAGVVGLWGIGFFSFDLMTDVFRGTAAQMAVEEGLAVDDFATRYQNAEIVIAPSESELPPLEQRLTSFHYFAAPNEEAARIQYLTAQAPDYVEGKLTSWRGFVSLVQNAGAFFGIYTFSVVTVHIGRKRAFLIAFLLAMFSTAFTFLFLGRITGFWDVYWMIPIMGFCQLSLFGGYAIYFPELFPTRLRSTGTSFCYNVGRLVAAAGPLALGTLNLLFAGYAATDPSLPMRYAGVTMCLAFLIGLLALPFAPETKGQPLPE